MTIKLGQFWIARMTQREMAVRIDDYEPKGGWVARSLSHGRRVWIRNADQLIRRCDENGLHLVADETEPNRRSKALPPEPGISTLPKAKTEERIPDLISRPMESKQALSLLDAVAIVLRGKSKGMSTKELVEVVQKRGLWNPTGKTPWLTLHSALSREIASKGTASRFQKAKERGKFSLR